MPEALSRGLEALLAQQENRGGSAPVRAAGAAISQRYRTRVGTGERLIRSDTEALAYAVSRMPATFAAVYDALEKGGPACPARRAVPARRGHGHGRGLLEPRPGGMNWGAPSAWTRTRRCCGQPARSFSSVRLLCRTPGCFSAMRRAARCPRGRTLSSPPICWANCRRRGAAALRAMWDAADRMLLLVLPGTPQGYAAVMRRAHCFCRGAHISPRPARTWAPAPCRKNDWCHFSCRVPRTRLHRQIKGGSAPYEDEKYAYLAAVRAQDGAGGGFRYCAIRRCTRAMCA